MNNKRTLLILIAVFVLLVAGASVLYTQLGAELAPEQLATEPTQTQGAEATGATEVMAPDFAVYDINGKEVRLSDHYGKPDRKSVV